LHLKLTEIILQDGLKTSFLGIVVKLQISAGLGIEAKVFVPSADL
jgi:hypothetical protein